MGAHPKTKSAEPCCNKRWCTIKAKDTYTVNVQIFLGRYSRLTQPATFRLSPKETSVTSGPAQWSSVCRKKTWSRFRRPPGTIAALTLAGSRPSEASFCPLLCSACAEMASLTFPATREGALLIPSTKQHPESLGISIVYLRGTNVWHFSFLKLNMMLRL